VLEHHVPSRIQTVQHGFCRPRIDGSTNWPDQTRSRLKAIRTHRDAMVRPRGACMQSATDVK
jgi:hypothetical protein